MIRTMALSALLALSAHAAQSTHQHPAPPVPPAAHDPADPTPAMHLGMLHLGVVQMGGLERLSGRAFDRAYLSMMIAHHQAGVDMSEALLPRLRDPRVREWAQIVISGQRGEIVEMTAMLRDFQLGSVDQAMHDAMAHDMQGMLAEVRAATHPEEAFVTHMLAHHATGVLMATLALARSDNALLRQDAQGVVRVQAEQMNQYRSWQPAT